VVKPLLEVSLGGTAFVTWPIPTGVELNLNLFQLALNEAAAADINLRCVKALQS
jgi:hypothetical protein